VKEERAIAIIRQIVASHRTTPNNALQMAA
jgi:hypothetical protein